MNNREGSKSVSYEVNKCWEILTCLYLHSYESYPINTKRTWKDVISSILKPTTREIVEYIFILSCYSMFLFFYVLYEYTNYKLFFCISVFLFTVLPIIFAIVLFRNNARNKKITEKIEKRITFKNILCLLLETKNFNFNEKIFQEKDIHEFVNLTREQDFIDDLISNKKQAIKRKVAEILTIKHIALSTVIKQLKEIQEEDRRKRLIFNYLYLPFIVIPIVFIIAIAIALLMKPEDIAKINRLLSVSISGLSIMTLMSLLMNYMNNTISLVHIVCNRIIQLLNNVMELQKQEYLDRDDAIQLLLIDEVEKNF